MDETPDLSDNSVESSSSSKSGLNIPNQTIILELHDIKKDMPAAENATPEVKSKKKRRGRVAVENKTDPTKVSPSELVPTVTDSAGKEEFFDADGSSQDLSAIPAAALVLALQQSEHNQELKLDPATRTQATRENSNAITKTPK
ncbi:uncharacterized protein LOC128198261 [Bicyclus anynana]|uniref:Uncharacterized protein LOC128198261 n=1 Tax=Bicyclus anynana TaxID=110368 RepID=A0ABM3LHL8_BICAN|nr:uncharacterized protein LOC128198261 [Bicyclus anynana]